jgi:two-component system response regulator AtoC
MNGPTHTADGGVTADGESLLCIDGDRSYTLRIPASGQLVIGRGSEAGLSVEDPQVSRSHAQLLAAPDGLRVADLGSRHGTLVNGERISEPRVLRTGDVVTLGNTLVVVRRARAIQAREVVDHGVFARRLAEELARCIAYERELSLLCVRCDAAPEAIVAHLGERVRGAYDLVARLDARHVGILLPELDGDDALAVAQRLVEGLPQVRVGVATAPYDGLDADSLIGATRAACEAGSARIVHASAPTEVVTAGNHRIVIGDPAMGRLYELARRVARSGIPVLVHGETGVGKELAAATVHASSPRDGGPFISVNCAAIPETLAESELFGHVKGAFSGAVANKVGYLEAASGGTLFLDEIGELSLVIQAKLLRVLESGELIRVGEVQPRHVDIRIVAATNRDLTTEIDAGRFRRDLYFRLGAARLEIPPLRDRPRDLAILASLLLREACTRLGRAPLALSIPVAIAMFRYGWPGNIRELRHVIEYATAAVPDRAMEIELWHLPPQLAEAARTARDGAPAREVTRAMPAPPPGTFRPIADEIRDLERTRMVEALRAANGVQNRAADLIEMPLRTFVTKLKRYAITPGEYT